MDNVDIDLFSFLEDQPPLCSPDLLGHSHSANDTIVTPSNRLHEYLADTKTLDQLHLQPPKPDPRPASLSDEPDLLLAQRYSISDISPNLNSDVSEEACYILKSVPYSSSMAAIPTMESTMHKDLCNTTSQTTENNLPVSNENDINHLRPIFKPSYLAMKDRYRRASFTTENDYENAHDSSVLLAYNDLIDCNRPHSNSFSYNNCTCTCNCNLNLSSSITNLTVNPEIISASSTINEKPPSSPILTKFDFTYNDEISKVISMSEPPKIRMKMKMKMKSKNKKRFIRQHHMHIHELKTDDIITDVNIDPLDSSSDYDMLSDIDTDIDQNRKTPSTTTDLDLFRRQRNRNYKHQHSNYMSLFKSNESKCLNYNDGDKRFPKKRSRSQPINSFKPTSISMSKSSSLINLTTHLHKNTNKNINQLQGDTDDEDDDSNSDSYTRSRSSSCSNSQSYRYELSSLSLEKQNDQSRITPPRYSRTTTSSSSSSSSSSISSSSSSLSTTTASSSSSSSSSSSNNFIRNDNHMNSYSRSTTGIGKPRRGRKPTITEDSSKTFICSFCSRRFRRQEHLKRHYRSLHTDDKPFGCTVCGKRFSRSDNLTQHMRTRGHR